MTTPTLIAASIFAAAAILAAPVALAQPPKSGAAKPGAAPRWNKEPDSFLGIRFDAPFPGDVPRCPTWGTTSVNEEKTMQMGQLCWGSGISKTSYRLYNGPQLGFGYEVWVTTIDGLPAHFYMRSRSSMYPALRGVFVTRYGAPSSAVTEEVTTKAGGKFQSEQMKWIGPNVSIFVQEMFGDINTTVTSVDTAAYKRQIVDGAMKSTKDAASRL